MVLTILAVAPVLALLLVMAAQPLFELWDARASDDARAARVEGDLADADVPPLPVAPAAYPEALGDVTAPLRIPAPRRPLTPARPSGARV